MSNRLPSLLVVATAACNQIYGIEKTNPVPDAPLEFFDVREDFECPPTGGTPRFGTTLTTVQQMCTQFNRSEDGTIATAYCGQAAAGPIDGPFTPIASLAGATTYVQPRLAPEGDQLFVRENTTGTVHVYARGADYTFTASHTVTVPTPATDIRIGTPSRGPMRRMFTGSQGDPNPEEIEIAPDGSATSVHKYMPSELGVFFAAGAPNMTPDGLHIAFPARDSTNTASYMMYADRMTISDRFGTARVLEGVAYVFDYAPFLDAHCSRLYTWTTDSVVWLQRLEDP